MEVMKNLDTLVQDIYAILETGKVKVDGVNLGSMISSRLSETKSGPALRMSNAGEKCVRKLWFRQNQPASADTLPGPTRLKFLIGDIHGLVIPQLAEQAGHKVEALEEEVKFEGVVGHVDAIIDGTLIDVKSANSRSMEKFRKHTLERDDPFGYLDQISLYAMALEGDGRISKPSEVAFVAADKELGHIVVDKYTIKPKPWSDIIRKIKDALARPSPPDRYYSDEADGASGNRGLCLQCRYCEYKQTCWADSNGGKGLRGFLYAGGIKWLTAVRRTPDVKEINTSSKVEQITESKT
jgi:hypothetical protein